MKILVLNAGSSSQKNALYEVTDDSLPGQASTPLWEASIDWSHQAGRAEIKVQTATGATYQNSLETESRSEAVTQVLATLWQGETKVIETPTQIDAVGHRVVHGGQHYRQSVVVTAAVKAAIAELAALAPSHNPANLAGIEAVEAVLGTDVPQVAVFDTAFHSQIPEAAALYPLPHSWVEQGIRRYGFHGISHGYCAQRAAQILNRELQDLRLIICHLGNGCSLSAVSGGHSVDTTMGFTPLDGLMMGTRSGSVDPGILLHILRTQNISVETLDRLLNKESGLKGISGVSGDMRQIQSAIADGNSRAQLAFDIYIHRLRRSIGAMLASLNGLDALVFTAGVGENAAPVRSATCAGLAFLGLQLDATKNQSRPVDQDIAAAESTVRVLVVHTQEDWAIAQECWHLLEAFTG
ncbi:MAG: acetate kinase [Cyanobacteria bacterium P01_H01_bin.119]